MEKVITSKHVVEDRMDRAMFIAQHLGWGEMVLEHYNSNRNSLECITSTGIILVKDASSQKLITCYPADEGIAIRLHRLEGYQHCRTELLERIKKNRKLMNKFNYSY